MPLILVLGSALDKPKLGESLKRQGIKVFPLPPTGMQM